MSQGRQPPWLWSASMNCHYYLDQRTNQYVLSDGRRIPVPRQPSYTQPTSTSSGPSYYNPQCATLPQTVMHRGPISPQTNPSRYTSGNSSGVDAGAADPSASAAQPAPAQSVDYSNWVTDEIARYRLTKIIVEGWLRQRFGPYVYNVRPFQDNFTFRVPRSLRDDEIDDILELKVYNETRLRESSYSKHAGEMSEVTTPASSSRYAELDRSVSGSSRQVTESSSPTRDPVSPHNRGSLGSVKRDTFTATVDERLASQQGTPDNNARRLASRQSRYELPICKVAQAQLYYDSEKGIIKGKKVSLPHAHLTTELNGRDHVFFVDDSQSMKPFWDDMVRLLRLLAYITENLDSDKLELYFLRSREVYKFKRSSHLVSTVESHIARGTTTLEGIFDQHLREYCGKIDKSKEILRIVNQLSRRSIYVFTDGVLEGGDDQQGHAAIETLVAKLKARELPRGQIGIQFISFGNNEKGVARLKRLDDLKEDKRVDLDIVDTEPSDGNIWKMLLGAINAVALPRPGSRMTLLSDNTQNSSVSHLQSQTTHSYASTNQTSVVAPSVMVTGQCGQSRKNSDTESDMSSLVGRIPTTMQSLNAALSMRSKPSIMRGRSSRDDIPSTHRLPGEVPQPEKTVHRAAPGSPTTVNATQEEMQDLSLECAYTQDDDEETSRMVDDYSHSNSGAAAEVTPASTEDLETVSQTQHGHTHSSITAAAASCDTIMLSEWQYPPLAQMSDTAFVQMIDEYLYTARAADFQDSVDRPLYEAFSDMSEGGSSRLGTTLEIIVKIVRQSGLAEQDLDFPTLSRIVDVICGSIEQDNEMFDRSDFLNRLAGALSIDNSTPITTGNEDYHQRTETNQESVQVVDPSSINSQSSFSQSNWKGKGKAVSKKHGAPDDDDDGDTPNKRAALGDEPGDGAQQAQQLPCVFKWCEGRNPHISVLLRQLDQHTSKREPGSRAICQKCFESFGTLVDKNKHMKTDKCARHCVLSDCPRNLTKPSITSASILELRHCADDGCPTEKGRGANVWRYLYAVCDPSCNDVPHPDLEFGRSRSHGSHEQQSASASRVGRAPNRPHPRAEEMLEHANARILRLLEEKEKARDQQAKLEDENKELRMHSTALCDIVLLCKDRMEELCVPLGRHLTSMIHRELPKAGDQYMMALQNAGAMGAGVGFENAYMGEPQMPPTSLPGQYHQQPQPQQVCTMPDNGANMAGFTNQN